MRLMTTAAVLNVMIQAHIDALEMGVYVWHSGVYLQDPDASGCNWNIEINCNDDVLECGAVISGFLDDLRTRFVIPADDVSATPAYDYRSRQL